MGGNLGMFRQPAFNANTLSRIVQTPGCPFFLSILLITIKLAQKSQVIDK